MAMGLAAVALAGERRAAGPVCRTAALLPATAMAVAHSAALFNDRLDGICGAHVGAAANVHGLCVLLLPGAIVPACYSVRVAWKLPQLGALVTAVAAAPSGNDGNDGDDGNDKDGRQRRRWRCGPC